MLVNWAHKWTLTWNSKHYLAANICLECVNARKSVHSFHWTFLWRRCATKIKQIIQCKQCFFSTQTNVNHSMNKKSFINNLSWSKMPMWSDRISGECFGVFKCFTTWHGFFYRSTISNRLKFNANISKEKHLCAFVFIPFIRFTMNFIIFLMKKRKKFMIWSILSLHF